MSKLVIDKLSIEKSDKDISTGIVYELSDGINLICGNNEAGKSSLMKFIKEGLFRLAKTDSGKIYFSVDTHKYRADIKNSSKKQDRLKLFDCNNNEINPDFIEQLINQKYFIQGFTINLDDLMTLKYDNNSLVNVIKDPSGDKLNNLIQNYKKTIDYYIGEKNKPKKPISDITNKLTEINSQIASISQKEEKYNNTVLQIKELKDELKELDNREKFAEYILGKRENYEKIDVINSQIKIQNSQFNSKLYDNRQEYAQIAQNIGVHISNQNNIKSLEEKIENINTKINDLILKLKENFGIYAQEQDFLNFETDYGKINEIKNLYNEINEKNSDINAYRKTNEDIEETILKLENDLNSLKLNYKGLENDNLTRLFSMLDDRLKQIKSIDFDIEELQKHKNSKQTFVIINQIALWLFAIGFASACFYFFHINQIKYAYVFVALFAAILAFIGFIFNKNQIKDTILRKEENKNTIIAEIKENIKTYFPEIINKNGSFLILTLEETAQNLKKDVDRIVQLSNDKNFNYSKITSNNKKIADLQKKIIENTQLIESLLKNELTQNGKTYIESVNIISSIKDEIINSKNIAEEIRQLKLKNNEIFDKFNAFITNNEININLSSDLEENFSELRKYTDNNNDIKKELDRLFAVLENLKQETKDNNFIRFKDIEESNDIKSILNELEAQKSDKLNILHNCEVIKSRLEEVESLSTLKNEKNVVLNKYRNIVKEIITAKAVLNITSLAKKNFDRTQPDLINAQKYLKILTNGKYSKINLELEEIMDENETIIKKWNELSRGTKEQLYLALRLGYASNYTQKDSKRPHLPLIIDDAFVNFDPERTKSTLACLYEFSETNQILFFTCHTQSVRGYFKDLGITEKVNCIEL